MPEKICDKCKYMLLAPNVPPCRSCYDRSNWEPAYTESKKPTVTKAEIIRRLEAVEKLVAAAQVTTNEPEVRHPWRSWCNGCQHIDRGADELPCLECYPARPTKWEKKV